MMYCTSYLSLNIKISNWNTVFGLFLNLYKLMRRNVMPKCNKKSCFRLQHNLNHYSKSPSINTIQHRKLPTQDIMKTKVTSHTQS